MGLDKSEIKLAILQELGCKFDDMLEGVQHDKFRAEGAARALIQATKAIRSVASLVDDDVDKERYDLPTAAKIKEYIDRAATIVESMAKNATNQQMAGGGSIVAMDQVVKYLKKEYDSEEAKRKALEESEDELDKLLTGGEEPKLHERPTGRRPPPTVKQRRRAQEAAPEPEAPRKTVSMKDHVKKRPKSDHGKDS